MAHLRQAIQSRCAEAESTLTELIQEGIIHQKNLTEQGQGLGKGTDTGASVEITTSNTTTTNQHRDRATIVLCRRSKLGQIQLFSDLLCSGSEASPSTGAIASSSPSPHAGASASPGPGVASPGPGSSRDSDQETRHLIDIFHATKEMCSGGVGGEREVGHGLNLS